MTRARSWGSFWAYSSAIALGYLLGSISVFAFAALAGDSSSSALARVGFALREEPSAVWVVRDADLRSARSSLASSERDAFDLVVAVRGLDNGGSSDWTRAEQLCRTLTWPRCDKEALAQLRELSRP